MAKRSSTTTTRKERVDVDEKTVAEDARDTTSAGRPIITRDRADRHDPDHLDRQPDDVAPPIEDIGGAAGADMLDGVDPTAGFDLADMPGQSEAFDPLEGLTNDGLDDPLDFDELTTGSLDGRTHDDGLELGPGGIPEDSGQYTGDGTDDVLHGLGYVGGVLGFAAVVVAPPVGLIGGAAAVTGAASFGGLIGSDISKASEGEVEGEFGDGKPAEDDPDSTNNPDEDSDILNKKDHGPTTNPDGQSTEPEPETGQSTEPEDGQSTEPEDGQSTEPEDGGGVDAGEVEEDVEPDTTPAEDKGPDADPEGHAEWLARQDPSILETYLAIEEQVRAGSEVNPNPMAEDTSDTIVIPDQIDYGQDQVAVAIDVDIDEFLGDPNAEVYDDTGE